MQHVRLDHDSQRQLLQMRKLWDDIRLRIDRPQGPGLRHQGWTRFEESVRRNQGNTGNGAIGQQGVKR